MTHELRDTCGAPTQVASGALTRLNHWLGHNISTTQMKCQELDPKVYTRIRKWNGTGSGTSIKTFFKYTHTYVFTISV